MMARFSFFRGLSMLLVGALMAVVFVAAGPGASKVQAADLNGFDPGFIISDEVFFNSSTMSASAIQNFLNAKAPSCTDYTVGTTKYTCIKNYTTSSADRVADSRCTAVSGKSGQSAAAIIYTVAKACGINPQVILVTLQKENGLITSAKSPGSYRTAMGYGCPDTAPCDTQYYGFFNQVYKASSQFIRYGQSTGFNHNADRTSNVGFHPNTSCGSTPVYIRNKATAALYNYTPYQPNAAALKAGYSVGDSCSSYGNRNFYNYFTDWFGAPANLLSGGSFDGSTLTGWRETGGNSDVVHMKNDDRAHSGSGFLSTSSAVAGRTIYNGVSRDPLKGQAFAGTVWVRSGSDTENYQGKLTLRTTGGTSESITKIFDVGSEWTEVSVWLNIANSGHTGMRLQITEDVAGATLFVDTASVTVLEPNMNLKSVRFKSWSFESSATKYWKTNTGSPRVISYTSKAGREAYHMDRVLRIRTASSSASVAQTSSRSTKPGESITYTAWVRSASPDVPVRGRLAVAALGGSTESSYTYFTAGAEWTQVSTTLSISKSAHSKLKAAIYVYNTPVSLEVDMVEMLPNLISQPSFEGSTLSGWSEPNSAPIETSIVRDSSQAVDGTRYARLLRTSDATARLASSTVSRYSRAGDSYSFGVWLRSSSAEESYITELRVIAAGGSTASDVGRSTVTVGPEWTYYEVPVTISDDRTDLRVDIRAGSMTFPLEIDGATLR
jgi:hypothetical protein